MLLQVMSGNGFLIRVKEIPADQALLPTESDIKKVGLKTSVRYTAVQVGFSCLIVVALLIKPSCFC